MISTVVAAEKAQVHTATMLKRLVCFTFLLSVTATPSSAVCSGESIEREYREADIVVRARIVSEINAGDDEPGAAFKARWGGGGPVVLYGLRTVEVLKGSPGPRISFFQERNSGAFYLDADKDYLLFLTYIRPYPGRPSAARGAMHVRHACGQSKLWAEVRPGDLVALRQLSGRR